jgi:hypothetical protein
MRENKDILDIKLDETSKKNLGQLLNTLEEMNCNQGVLAVVKMVFWKNLDEIKEKIRK